MKRIVWVLLLLPVVLLTVAVRGQPSVSPGSGKSVLDEDVLMRFFHEPEAHFHKAREKFFRRDYAGAAQSVRTAAGFVRLEILLAAPKGQELVNASAADLERLARGVEDGTVRSARTLDQAFARAHYALGKNHNFKALGHLASNQPQRAGQHLGAAVHHAEHGYLWAGLAEKDDVRAIFKKAGEVARRLLGRVEAIDAEMKGVVNALEDRLEDVAKEARWREDLVKEIF